MFYILRWRNLLAHVPVFAVLKLKIFVFPRTGTAPKTRMFPFFFVFENWANLSPLHVEVFYEVGSWALGACECSDLNPI